MSLLFSKTVLTIGVFAFSAQLFFARQPSPSPSFRNEEQKTENKRRQQSVIQWFREKAIPLKTVEAGNGFADLRPLKKIFKDVRFVGLGEETHGTREVFQFKHRMLEFLVKEMGFRVFAIEAKFCGQRKHQRLRDWQIGRRRGSSRQPEVLGLEHGRSASDDGLDTQL